jgi:hypothetical protein
MPYYKKDNILFIHIPKTGGSSIENYFYNKYNMDKTQESLYSNGMCNKDIKHSFQHCTMNEIINYNHLFKINFNQELFIFTCVRNPYDKIISELFFRKKIDSDSTLEKIENNIELLFNDNNYIYYDNHRRPQHLFITDKDGKIHKNIVVLKTEELNNSMIKMGFTDFNNYDNVTNSYSYLNKDDIKYKKYLNSKIIRMIHFYYKKDFEIFNYKMLSEE